MRTSKHAIAILSVALLAHLPLVRAEDAPAASDSSGHALMCPKCEAVWVKTPTVVNSHQTTVYSTSKKMVCDDCKSAAANFFTTGKWEHACKVCGDMKVCDAIQADSPTSQDKATEDGRAVMCSKCQALWVKEKRVLPRATVYVPVKQQPCSDCQKAAVSYLAGEKIMKGACGKCGGEMTACAVGDK